MRHPFLKAAAAVGATLLISCSGGDGGSGPSTPPPTPVASVTVAPSSATIMVGATTTLTATPLDASNNALSGRAVTWTSSDQSVATVSTAGVVTGVAPGNATISATSEGRSGSAQVTVQAPVASVSVAPATSTLLVGGSVTLTATVKDAANNVLTGRTVTWTTSNPSVATVSPAGVVATVSAGGPVTITATSEGQSGTAQVTVLAPVASVVFTGNFRTKVGDTYQYTVTARLADGTVVTRPTTWSVAEPNKATITQGGLMTPTQTGTITLQVTIDGVTWETTADAYDWVSFGSGTVFGVVLAADLSITNKWGTTEYPDLAMGCSGGLFVLFVGTDHFVTSSGGVTYGFDNDPLENAFWLEFDSFSNLGHPGPDNATRFFATRTALARKFWFAFTEFNGPAKATMFRVTGLASRLPAFSTCPTSSPAASPSIITDPTTALQALAGTPAAMTAERALRSELRASVARVPELTRQGPASTNQEARRRPEPRR